jgi:hypothetical protein
MGRKASSLPFAAFAQHRQKHLTRGAYAAARQSAKATLLHMDVQMLRAQDAQEQPFADGRRSDV